ncbi:hypothetical protein F5X96DRAFT_689692 [Biscogniauxia mediterranea]|nr:hypothetical protein F5X96DRAFT_689692 [Biscogniauxia mediterranea]
MARLWRSTGLSAALAALVIVFISPYLYRLALPYLSERFRQPELEAIVCPPHQYSTELISLDPLLIYMESFLTAPEITELLEAGEPEFAPSVVYKQGRLQGTADRTSSSAGLPRTNPTVQCVLRRAQQFLGTMFDPARDDIGPPQLVRYVEGQRFNQHHDWYDRPQPARKGMLGKGRSWNRLASFFATLEDQCTGGETWFPRVTPTHARGNMDHLWRTHEEGGLAFKPIAGNAIFWVNLHPNGTGDERVIHAGLPVEKGQKTAMNIWPRKFYD